MNILRWSWASKGGGARKREMTVFGLKVQLCQRRTLTYTSAKTDTPCSAVSTRELSYLYVLLPRLHGMQTRSIDENSVCPSVRLSVCQTRALWQNARKICLDFIPHERSFSLVFLEEEWLMAGDPFNLKFLGKSDRVGAKLPIFNR